MRRWAFIVAILGMFVLALMLNRSPISVENYSDLEVLEVNTRVSVSGKVVSERVLYEGKKLIELL